MAVPLGDVHSLRATDADFESKKTPIKSAEMARIRKDFPESWIWSSDVTGK